MYLPIPDRTGLLWEIVYFFRTWIDDTQPEIHPRNFATRYILLYFLVFIQNKQVTLKVNVSYTHHSHIIGEGGQTITRVRQSTGCHIHFPDSNRSFSEMKSNQVSITGSMEGVEKARAQVRVSIVLKKWRNLKKKLLSYICTWWQTQEFITHVRF